MKSKLLKMKITGKSKAGYLFDISCPSNRVAVSFCLETRQLLFHNHNDLTDFLLKNEVQLRKILHNKRPESFFTGFELNFAIFEDRDPSAFSDKKRILVSDKRNGENKSYALEKGIDSITKLYTDGSFFEKKDQGGIACIIEYANGECLVDYRPSTASTSTLTELHAAIRGLEILCECKEIRIVTDSQYVRKGLTEWIRNWNLNDWHTANGTKVKNIDEWKRFEKLTAEKYIEIEWVKSHRNHLQNVLCDRLAKAAALL
ncbi:MAG TPA: ribonuclease H [Clostridia bacterium]|nr:ribonuclease H [Clostridia bacterium]